MLFEFLSTILKNQPSRPQYDAYYNFEDLIYKRQSQLMPFYG
jgi:hypothetical protein